MSTPRPESSASVVRTHRQTAAASKHNVAEKMSVCLKTFHRVTMKSLRSGKNILLICLAVRRPHDVPMIIDVIAAMTRSEEYLPA